MFKVFLIHNKQIRLRLTLKILPGYVGNVLDNKHVLSIDSNLDKQINWLIETEPKILDAYEELCV